jgi:hypothetical protein
MTDSVVLGGKSANLTASGYVSGSPSRLLGFYVNSTNAGTIVIKDGGSGGAALTGTITPAIGWHFLPVQGTTDLYATIGGTALNVTLVYNNL